MNFLEFSDRWIKDNAYDSFYPNMPDHLRSFVDLVRSMHHSGPSMMVFTIYVIRLMTDYQNQFQKDK